MRPAFAGILFQYPHTNNEKGSEREWLCAVCLVLVVCLLSSERLSFSGGGKRAGLTVSEGHWHRLTRKTKPAKLVLSERRRKD